MSYKPVAVFYNGYLCADIVPREIMEDNGKKRARLEVDGEMRVMSEFTGEFDWEKPYYVEYDKIMDFFNLLESDFPKKEAQCEKIRKEYESLYRETLIVGNYLANIKHRFLKSERSK